MKSLLILLVASVAFSLPLGDEDITKQWEDFKTKYNKSYATPEEEAKRFDIFKRNVANFEAHNKLYESGQSTYTQGVNHYADWAVLQISEFLNKGLKKSKNPSGGKVFKRTEGFVLPESVDWREQGVVTKVRDQIANKCGSCWAFTNVGALESQYAMKTGNLVLLSEQNLMDCTLNDGNRGCGGGEEDPTYNYIMKYGVESEADYPYEAKNGECRYNASKIVTKISNYVWIQPFDELGLQEAVATKGPVGISIDFGITTGLLFYKSGIYDGPCSKTTETHGSLVVGYGSENGQDYYIIKNSLGEDYGENGYYRVQRNVGQNTCLAFGGTYPII